MTTHGESTTSGSRAARHIAGSGRFARAAACLVVATQLLACGEQVVGWPHSDTSSTRDTGETVAPTFIHTGETVAPTVIHTRPMSLAYAVARLVAYSVPDESSSFTPDSATVTTAVTSFRATVTTETSDLEGSGLVSPDAGFTSGTVKADLRRAYMDLGPASLPPDSWVGLFAGTSADGAFVLDTDVFYVPGPLPLVSFPLPRDPPQSPRGSSRRHP